ECSFEAILKKYKLTGDPALVLLGKIVNGADTDNTLYQQPEAAGLKSRRGRFPPSRLQGRSRGECRRVDRLRRALRLLPGDGAARQAQRRFRSLDPRTRGRRAGRGSRGDPSHASLSPNHFAG